MIRRTDPVILPLLWQFDGGYAELDANGTPTSWNYYVTDHLGSTRMVVSSNDSKKFEATYDAWGNQTVTRNDIGFHRGYTGHEMLPEFGLINMRSAQRDAFVT